MKRKWLLIGIIVLLLGTCIIPATAQNTEKHLTSRGTWLYVGGSGPGNYTRIQDAIDDANEGDTIFVYSGIYCENLLVNESGINLVGEDKYSTNIDGSGRHDIIEIEHTDRININGFTIQNSNDAGILIDFRSNNNTISDSIISNNGIGVEIRSHSCNNNISGTSFFNTGLFVYDSYQNTITNNTVNGKNLVFLEGKSDMTIPEAGQVILINCTNIIVKNQDLSNASFGIELWNSNDCSILNNVLNSNTEEGIIFHYSSRNKIEGNSVSFNKYGISLLDGSCGNTITNNMIMRNDDWGIILCTEVNRNIVKNNIISYSDHGIIVYGWHNIICWNNISYNIEQGIYFSDMCLLNMVILNNFIENEEHISFDYIIFLQKNRFVHNYYDDHRTRLPKKIYGYMMVFTDEYPGIKWINWYAFDWFPAQEPYDIEVR